MKGSNQERQSWRDIIDSVSRPLRSLGKAVARVFKPAEEELPDIGVQPYEGDPAEEKRGRHRSWEG